MIIQYGDAIGEIVTAYDLVFMTSNEDDAIIHYQVKTSSDQNLTLKELTSANGPTGEDMRVPSHASTQSRLSIYRLLD